MRTDPQLLLLLALTLPLLEAGLAWVFAQLVVANMTAIIMVVDVDDAIFDVVFVIVVHKFFFACFVVDPTCVTGDLGHKLARYAWGPRSKGLLPHG